MAIVKGRDESLKIQQDKGCRVFTESGERSLSEKWHSKTSLVKSSGKGSPAGTTNMGSLNVDMCLWMNKGASKAEAR